MDCYEWAAEPLASVDQSGSSPGHDSQGLTTVLTKVVETVDEQRDSLLVARIAL